MTSREAKRLACYHAASVLRNALSAGWEFEEIVEHEQRRLGRAGRNDDVLFAAAITEIAEELERRGHQ